jgi:2-methylcitrate dehydratase PrpD
MELTLRDGTTLSKETRAPRGNFRNPLSVKDVVQKFLKCIPYSARPFQKDHIEGLLDLLYNLENLGNTRHITEMLFPS